MSEGYLKLQTRREFFRTGTAAVGAGALLGSQPATGRAATSKMFKNLGTGHIGVKAGQTQAADYAIRFGFGGVNVHAEDLEKMNADQRQAMLARMKEHGLRWGS